MKAQKAGWEETSGGNERRMDVPTWTVSESNCLELPSKRMPAVWHCLEGRKTHDSERVDAQTIREWNGPENKSRELEA